MEKTIRYRLSISRVFPKSHPRAGEPTHFDGQIRNALSNGAFVVPPINKEKIHTIRENFPLWATRIEKVIKGEAIIELYYWAGKPYRSKQIIFSVLDNQSGCGIQELCFVHPTDIDNNALVFVNTFEEGIITSSHVIGIEDIAKNDGLSLVDFKDWFRRYKYLGFLPIIHFTKFRY